jgi:hypothetical protein
MFLRDCGHEQLTRKHEWMILTPKTALLSWLGLFNWKLMVADIATIQAASTVITSLGARIFCMTENCMAECPQSNPIHMLPVKNNQIK